MNDWKDVPVTAGMLVAALESLMSNQMLVDFNMGGLMDHIAGAVENEARIAAGMEPLA